MDHKWKTKRVGLGLLLLSLVGCRAIDEPAQYGQPAGYQPGWTYYGTSEPEEWGNPYGGAADGGVR